MSHPIKYPYITITLLTLLTGCKVGPQYKTPETPIPIAYAEAQNEKTFIPNDADLATWWQKFNDPFLDSLLQETMSGSFDYRIALEQVSQARSQYWVQYTDILPEFDFDATASRFRTSRAFATSQPPVTTASSSSTTTTVVPPPFGTTTTNTTSSSVKTTAKGPKKIQNFFQLGFDAIWEMDFFGKLRSAADSAEETLEATKENCYDVKITVLAEVANTYTRICASQQQLALATQIVHSDEQLLYLALDRFSAGITNEQEVETARAGLEVDRATLKTIQTQLKENIYSLSVLLGKPPETLIEPFTTIRPIPAPFGLIPAGLPADLLRRRHDVRSADRQLAAATAEVRVAVAQLYPTISLTGSSSSFAANPLQGANVGFTSDKANKLFKNAARVWGIGALLTVPVFDFGKRLSGIDVQEALQRQSALFYQKTVISALQEVEVALTTYFNEEEREKSLRIAADSEKRSYDLTVKLYEAGVGNLTQVNQAKDIWLNAMQSLTTSQQALTSNLIAVYKSLGGEW